MEVLLELQNCYFHHKYHIRENGYNSIRVSKMPQSGLGSMQGLSSTKSCLQPKVVFYRRSFSTKGRLSTKVIFHRKSSSTEGRLPPKVFFQ